MTGAGESSALQIAADVDYVLVNERLDLAMALTPMQRRYQRFPRLMFLVRRLQRVNYEREMELLDILCDPAKTSIDVGAKLGMYTYRLLRHSCDVIAFEPIPLLVTMLERVFHNRPCRVMPCALSDAPGRAVMRVPYGKNGEVKFGRSTIEPENALFHDDVAHVEEIDVEVRTLDDCDPRNVGFIKIDVEGHELAVLRGAARTLEREVPTLLVEASDHHHPGAVANLRAFMTGHGYRGFFLRPGLLLDLDSVTDDSAFVRESIENFLFVHSSRPEVRTRLADRVQVAS
jgi:FkbM family methyltransferase